MYVCVLCVYVAFGDQTKASDPPGVELEMLLCAKGVQGILNLGLLKEQLVFVAAKPSLQP